MDIQWYPGHMAKMKRELHEKIGLVDVVIELLDARIPQSSKNPDLDVFAQNKKRLILLNKGDMSDPECNKRWETYYSGQGFGVMTINAVKGTGVQQIYPAAIHLMQDKIQARKQKGMVNVTIRAMVVGIPNVGKSTLINKLYGKKNAKTENRPGVTRKQQWIRVRKDFELLDTPGILWPKFEDPAVGEKLAATGAIKDTLLDFDELSLKLIDFLRASAPNSLEKRYGIEIGEGVPAIEVLRNITLARGFLMREGEPDLGRGAAIVIDEFRSGKLGKISLENPPVVS